MKSLFKFATSTALIVWIFGCGKQNTTLSLKDRTTSCPLYFASENLCAEISWMKGPSADVNSSFDIIFWNKDTGSSSGPFTDPTAQVGAFLRMSCCGTLSFPKTDKVDSGRFLVSNIKFTPGNWEIYVQLKQGENVDKQFVKVQIDD